MTDEIERRVWHLPDEAAMEAMGRVLIPLLPRGAVIFLHGELGAGKTTLVRGILRGLGYAASVKSPTYTIIEPHDLGFGMVYHLDLYRISDPSEIDFLGIDELYGEGMLTCIEWPDRGAGHLPPPDVEIWLSVHGTGRRLELAVA
ncbi:MAG: tRNA (adenosine(37)-N6)-threonylcarbamoyltransferase complex ATPase subunit type 1 TsaE, partial [Pseudomonadales bacterium]